MSAPHYQAGRILVVLALLLSAGGHWVVLQSVAWTNMLVERSREGTIMEAVRTTFDGAHPCGLCRKIESGRKEEKQEQKSQPVAKLKLFYETASCALFPPHGAQLNSNASAGGQLRIQVPRVPPPRGC